MTATSMQQRPRTGLRCERQVLRCRELEYSEELAENETISHRLGNLVLLFSSTAVAAYICRALQAQVGQ